MTFANNVFYRSPKYPTTDTLFSGDPASVAWIGNIYSAGWELGIKLPFADTSPQARRKMYACYPGLQFNYKYNYYVPGIDPINMFSDDEVLVGQAQEGFNYPPLIKDIPDQDPGIDFDITGRYRDTDILKRDIGSNRFQNIFDDIPPPQLSFITGGNRPHLSDASHARAYRSSY